MDIIDNELIRRDQSGDREAFGEIYRGYFDDVYKYLYWNVGSREEAEGLSEEVFYRALKFIGKYDEDRASIRSWVMRIAHNLLVDHYRHRARHPQVELAQEVEAPGDITSGLEEEERARLLRQAMEELTLEQRQALQMKYFLQMSNAEVDRTIGRREGL